MLLPNTGARQEFQLIKAWLAIYWREGCRGGGGGCQLKSLVVKPLPHGNPAAAVPAAAVPFAFNPSTHIRCEICKAKQILSPRLKLGRSVYCRGSWAGVSRQLYMYEIRKLLPVCLQVVRPAAVVQCGSLGGF